MSKPKLTFRHYSEIIAAARKDGGDENPFLWLPWSDLPSRRRSQFPGGVAIRLDVRGLLWGSSVFGV